MSKKVKEFNGKVKPEEVEKHLKNKGDKVKVKDDKSGFSIEREYTRL